MRDSTTVETEKEDGIMTWGEGRQGVRNGRRRNGPVLDNTLKNEDFPTFGKPVMGMRLERDGKGCHIPTIPILRLLDGRPRRIFFSGAAAFFGGIFFLSDGGDG